MNRH